MFSLDSKANNNKTPGSMIHWGSFWIGAMATGAIDFILYTLFPAPPPL